MAQLADLICCGEHWTRGAWSSTTVISEALGRIFYYEYLLCKYPVEVTNNGNTESNATPLSLSINLFAPHSPQRGPLQPELLAPPVLVRSTLDTRSSAKLALPLAWKH